MRTFSVLIPTALAAIVLSACGSESVSVPETDSLAYQGAEIFSTHCAGCHTISAAGTQGSGNRSLRAQGPNFDQRVESYDDVLFAIHNGGFSGAIMPQNIVVGDEAAKIATFLAKYSGSDVDEPAQPLPSANTETGEPDAVAGEQTTPSDTNEQGDGAAAGGGSTPPGK